MSRCRAVWLLVCFILVTTVAPSFAQGLITPVGPVVLTVTGNVAQTNRGPFDANRDLLFKNTHVSFSAAAEFDLAMLEALGMHAIRADYPKGEAVHIYEGPLLRDVLKVAGARGATVKLSALDGYTQEIPISETESWPIVLAVKRDGRYLALGGFGPAWVAFPRAETPAYADENDDKWVWGIIHITVE